MISIKDSIPKKTKNYLLGQDILWTQFNEINFYVEDVEQENFYFQILKKLFPVLKINRIFPLGGKLNIITEARRKVLDKKNIFILDLDFDGILNRREDLPNLFYLKKYSIENYLFEKVGIYETIKEDFPKIKEFEIGRKMNYQVMTRDIINILKDLTCSFLIIQKHRLGLPYFKIVPSRDCDFQVKPAQLKKITLNFFNNNLEAALKTKNSKYTIFAQKRHVRKYFKTIDESLSNVPGKYILNVLKFRLERLSLLKSVSGESFIYRLAKNCDLTSLKYLEEDILDYID